MRLVVLLFFTLALGKTASAQITAATVSGTIKDQTGAVVPGAHEVPDGAISLAKISSASFIV